MTYGLFWTLFGLVAAADIVTTAIKWRRRKVDAERRQIGEPPHRAWRVVGSHSTHDPHQR